MSNERNEQEYDQVLEHLEQNRQRHFKELYGIFSSMLPQTSPYISICNIKPERIDYKIGKQQSEELAEKISNLIFDQLRKNYIKYKTLPIGGNFGNIVSGINERIYGPDNSSQMECFDWTDLLFHELEALIKKYFDKGKNSFSVEHIELRFTKFGLPLPHNFIRITGPGPNYRTINIDPWKSGGEEIIRQVESREMRDGRAYKNDKIDGGRTRRFPCWENGRYFYLEPKRKEKEAEPISYRHKDE